MMRSGNLQRAGRYLFLASAVLLLLAVLGGCNYDWTYFRSTFTGKSVEFVSVVPAHLADDGTCTRQCSFDTDRDVNSLLLSFNIIGSGVTAQEGTTQDKDPAVRPGDLLKTPDDDRLTLGVQAVGDDDSTAGERLISNEHFNVKIDCLSPYPLAAYETACSVTEGISGNPDTLTYESYFPGTGVRPDPSLSNLSLAVMVDQSGSMIGYVEQKSFKEYSPEAKTMSGGKANISTENYGDRATDYQAFRSAAIQSLINQLNPGDRAGIFQFGEAVSGDGAKILCQAGTDDESLNRADCFGINRGILESSAFSDLQSGPKGRTPLWMAVKDVYNFMKTKETTAVRHIVIITDGPDTCANTSPDFMPYIRYYRAVTGKFEQGDQSFPCADTSYQNFLDDIHDDVYNADGTPKAIADVPVHISFIQMQSRGYPDVDPAQQEIACLTGGHYTFINANTLPKSKDDSGVNEDLWSGQHPLKVALDQAVTRFRNSMAGTWKAGVKVNALSTFYRMLNIDIEPVGNSPIHRAAADVIDTDVISEVVDGDVIEPPADVVEDTAAVDANIPVEDVVDTDTNVATDVVETDTNVGVDTNEPGEPCTDRNPVGLGVIGGAAIALKAEISVVEKEPSDALFDGKNMAKAVLAMVDTIDFRGAFHLAAGNETPDCLAWLPICSIAEDTTIIEKDGSGNPVEVQMKDVECMSVAFETETDVCRIGDMPFGTSCTGGKCCWGKCMPPTDNECKTDELDEVCNYVNKEDGTGCTGGGTCQKGKCVVAAS